MFYWIKLQPKSCSSVLSHPIYISICLTIEGVSGARSLLCVQLHNDGYYLLCRKESAESAFVSAQKMQYMWCCVISLSCTLSQNFSRDWINVHNDYREANSDFLEWSSLLALLFNRERGIFIYEHQLVHCNRFLLWPFQLKTFITSEPQSFLPFQIWFNSLTFAEALARMMRIPRRMSAFEEFTSQFGLLLLKSSIVSKKKNLRKVFLSIIFFNKSTLENYFAQLQMFRCLLVLEILEMPVSPLEIPVELELQ